MQRLISRVVLAVFVFPWAALAAEKTAHDLSESRDLIRNPGNKAYFDYEMGGTDRPPADLGEPLPDAARDALISALLGQPAARLPKDIRSGVVVNPIIPGTSLVWAVVPEEGKLPARLSIGVMRGDAKSPGAWAVEPIRDLELGASEEPLRFDFAPFTLGKLGRAFGLRTLIHGCGAGGSLCMATSLLLFVPVQGRLTKVFDARMSYFGNIAGDWHDDGTRDHTVSEQEAIVRIKGRHGPHDPPPVLEKVVKGRRAIQRWRWSERGGLSDESQTWLPRGASPGWYITDDPELVDTVNDDPPNLPASRFASVHTFARPEQNRTPDEWRAVGGVPGLGGLVNAAVVGAHRELYVGGTFTYAGEALARNVAVWDGHAWSPVGAGMEGEVVAMATDGRGRIYAAENVRSTTGSSETLGRVRVWDGTSWSPVGDATSPLAALAIDTGGHIYRARACQSNYLVGRPEPPQISVWNGTTWSNLVAGWLGLCSPVLGLDKTGHLYAAGESKVAGQSNVLAWDGSRWSELGHGVDRRVFSLAFDGTGRLHAAGPSVSVWQDGQWRSSGKVGLDGSVSSLLADGAGGFYASVRLRANATSFDSVLRWNGSSWLDLPRWASSAKALAVDDTGALFVASEAGGITEMRAWKGRQWDMLSTGLNWVPSFIALNEAGELFAANQYTGVVAVRKGSRWIDLGAPFERVEAMIADGRGHLLVAGHLPPTNKTRPGVFQWNGSTWAPLGVGDWGGVSAIAADRAGNIYVGGQFGGLNGAAGQQLAKWDGHSWSALGPGVEGGTESGPVVSALALDGAGILYAAGDFERIGGSRAHNIARWDGRAWSPLGDGTTFPVTVLAVTPTGRVYAGDGAVTMSAWDGRAWSAMAPERTPKIGALATDAAGNLYAAGAAISIDGQLATGGVPPEGAETVGLVARWRDGAWVPLATFDRAAKVLAFDRAGHIYAAGDFFTQNGRPLGYVARTSVPPSP